MIHWGIIGAGNIARRFAKSLAAYSEGRLVAVSCRAKEKGEAFAKEHGVPKVYVGHEALLADAEIDAVYIALPHGLHREWAIRSLQSKKAVLCEKPAVLNAGEMLDIAATAGENGVLFMEAMKTRFVPLYAKVKELIAEGRIGKPERIETSLCNLFSFDPEHPTYHTDPIQGGCLLDEGIYCASWLEDFSEGMPAITDYEGTVEGGVDYYDKAEIKYPNLSGSLTCAFDRAGDRKAVIYGTEGKLVVDELHRPERLTIFEKDSNVPAQDVVLPYVVDDFYGQIVHFSECMNCGKLQSNIMPLSASLRCAQLIDAVRDAKACVDAKLVHTARELNGGL